MRHSSFWQAVGFGVSTLVGTLLHFLYDWLLEAAWIAPFSGVNESTWEHMKLLFWPLFLFALVQRLFFRDQENYWCVKLAQVLLGLILIPVLFYTYNGVFGKSPDLVNIAIFFVSAAAAFLLETRLFKKGSLQCKRPWLAFAVICLIGVLFVVFTFATPQIPIFQDPITGTYGINSKTA
mgnify:CR=1 FL=1